MEHHMRDDSENNYISVGSWMGMMFITAIPVIGWIMILVWAFSGENESRKNYYRALLIWVMIGVLFVVTLILLGTLPDLLDRLPPRR
jgi:Na+/melibiose symporter-like transporter